MLALWEGLRTYGEDKGTATLSDPKISALVNGLVTLGAPLRALIQEQIKSGEIGPELNRGGRSIYDRINKWLWDNYEIKYTPTKDSSDYLKKAIEQAQQDTMDYPLKVGISSAMDWQPGTFGDSGSCFFERHSICRYYLNSLPNFQTLRFYSSAGKGIGRCLLLSDIPHRGCIIVFNAYPGHKESSTRNVYSEVVQAFIAEQEGKEHTVTYRNISNGGEGWLYLNGLAGNIVHPVGMKLPEKVDLGLSPKKPDARELPGYMGACNMCSGFSYENDGSASYVLKDLEVIFCMKCAYRLKTLDTPCQKCGKKKLCNIGYTKAYDGLPGYGTIRKGEDGNSIRVCEDCAKEMDEAKRAVRRAKKELVPSAAF